MDLTYVLIFLNFVFFSLGQLTSISKEMGLNIYLFDIFLFLTNLILFLKIAKRGKFIINFPLIVFTFFFLFSFFYTFFLTYFYPFIEQVKVQSYLLRFTGYFLFGYLSFLLLRYEIFRLDRFKDILVKNFYFLSLLNLLQLIFLNDLTDLAKFGWDPHIGRLTGTFLDPNYMAFYLCLYFILNNYLLKNKYVEFISILSIFLTLSRNGILTFLFIYLVLNYKNLYRLIAVIVLSIIVILINPRIIERFSQFNDSNDSSYLRLVSWNEALSLFSFNNYSGIGFNNYRNFLEAYRVVDMESLSKNSSTSTDSSFLQIFITLGPVGFLIFMILLIGFIFPGELVKMNLVTILALLFNSLFINSLFYPQTSFLLFVVLFLGVYLKKPNLFCK